MQAEQRDTRRCSATLIVGCECGWEHLSGEGVPGWFPATPHLAAGLAAGARSAGKAGVGLPRVELPGVGNLQSAKPDLHIPPSAVVAS